MGGRVEMKKNILLLIISFSLLFTISEVKAAPIVESVPNTLDNILLHVGLAVGSLLLVIGGVVIYFRKK